MLLQGECLLPPKLCPKLKIKTRKYHHQFALNNAATHSENCLLEVALFRLVGDVKSFVAFLFSGSLMFKLGEAC